MTRKLLNRLRLPVCQSRAEVCASSPLASLVAPLLGPPEHPIQTTRFHTQSASDRRAAQTLVMEYQCPISLFRAEVPVLLDHPALDEPIAGRATWDIS
jgi:hypothetical protein